MSMTFVAILATLELRKRPGNSDVDNASRDCFWGRAFCLRPLKQSHDPLSTSLLPGLLRNSEMANSLASCHVYDGLVMFMLNHRIITYRMRAPISFSQKSVSTKWRIYKAKIWTPDASPSTHSISTNSMC